MVARILLFLLLIFIPQYAFGLNPLDSKLDSKGYSTHTQDSYSLHSIASLSQWKRLLHYRGKTSLIRQDSGFFLSPMGAINPQAELLSTLQAFGIDVESAHTNTTNTSSFLCSYPARAMFLSRFFPQLKEMIKTTHCVEYEEFLEIVPSDRVSLIFAAESDIYPGSAMGHIFLALEGEAKADLHKTFKGRSDLHIQKGQYLGYSLSFFANAELGLNPIMYVRALMGNLGGIYALQPLDNNTFEYLENEKRSLWKLGLKLDLDSKALLLAHLWELKDIPVEYSFITHNCNDALKSVLSVANEAFATQKLKPYQTPMEYLKSLENVGLLENLSVEIPQDKKAFSDKYGYNEILKARDSAKFSLGYENRASHSMMSVYFSPIYADITNANNAYKELIESRLMSIKGYVNLENASIFIDKIEALHLFSVADSYRTKSLSKYINLSFENPFDEITHTRLKPKLSFGAGFGSYVGNLSVYLLPLVGYDYVKNHNAFIDIHFGIVGRFERIRLIGRYDYFVDIANQRGYTQQASGFVGLNVYKQWDFYTQIQWKDTFKYGDYVSWQSGMSVNF